VGGSPSRDPASKPGDSPVAPVAQPGPAPVVAAASKGKGHVEAVAVPAPTILIDIASAPAAARVVNTRDESLLGVTPFRREVPREEGELELRLEKRGYLPRTVVVPLNSGFRGSVRLGKVPAPAPAAETIIKL
jgi:hypothetical protein